VLFEQRDDILVSSSRGRGGLGSAGKPIPLVLWHICAVALISAVRSGTEVSIRTETSARTDEQWFSRDDADGVSKIRAAIKQEEP
jgi:hypothetical protein